MWILSGQHMRRDFKLQAVLQRAAEDGVNNTLCPVVMNGVFAFLAGRIGPKPRRVLKITLGILLMSDWAEGG